MRTLSLPTNLFTLTIAVAAQMMAQAIGPVPAAQASADRWTSKTTPTCYIQIGNSQQRLDHLCGTHDPKPDRKRSPYELDNDGLPFVMKENFRSLREAQRKIEAANRKLEEEMPFSPQAKQLMAEQRAITQKMMSAANRPDSQALSQRYREIQQALSKDPSVKKAYDMMGRLYQQR